MNNRKMLYTSIALIVTLFIIVGCSKDPGFKGEWKTGREHMTITKKSADTFMVKELNGPTYVADLEDGMLVGRGIYGFVLLRLENDGNILRYNDLKYKKVSN